MELVAARIVSTQMKQGCYKNAWSHQERSRSRNMLCLQEHVMFPEGCVKRKDKSSRSNVSICWNRVSCGIKVDSFGEV
ncbi:hypothetical protein YC2023_017273 [Brassica napus]